MHYLCVLVAHKNVTRCKRAWFLATIEGDGIHCKARACVRLVHCWRRGQPRKLAFVSHRDSGRTGNHSQEVRNPLRRICVGYMVVDICVRTMFEMHLLFFTWCKDCSTDEFAEICGISTVLSGRSWCSCSVAGPCRRSGQSIYSTGRRLVYIRYSSSSVMSTALARRPEGRIIRNRSSSMFADLVLWCPPSSFSLRIQETSSCSEFPTTSNTFPCRATALRVFLLTRIDDYCFALKNRTLHDELPKKHSC